MRISKKDREELASLINAIHVAEMMRRDSQEQARELEKKDFFVGSEGEEYEGVLERAKRWKANGCRAEIELAEKFGIELPGLKWARELIGDMDR